MRQLVVLLKLVAGMFWGESPEVRAFLHLPPYLADPGTRAHGALRASSRALPSRSGGAARAARPAREERGRGEGSVGARGVGPPAGPTVEGHRRVKPVSPEAKARGRHVTFESFDQPAVEIEVDFAVVGQRRGRRLRRGDPGARGQERGRSWRRAPGAPGGLPLHCARGDARSLPLLWLARHAEPRALGPSCRRRAWGGGSTVINSAIVVRTPGDCFTRWEREYGIDGDALARRVWEHQDRIERELAAAVVPPDARGLSNVLAMDARRRARLGLALHGPLRARLRGAAASASRAARAAGSRSTNVNLVPEVLRARRLGALVRAGRSRRLRRRARRGGERAGSSIPVSRRRGARFLVRARRGVLVAASVTHDGRPAREERRQEQGARHALPRPPWDGHLRRLRRARRPERRRDAGLGLHGVPRRSWPQAGDPRHPARDGGRAPARRRPRAGCGASASTATSRCGSRPCAPRAPAR